MKTLISGLLVVVLTLGLFTQYYQNKFNDTMLKWLKLEIKEFHNTKTMCKFRRQNNAN